MAHPSQLDENARRSAPCYIDVDKVTHESELSLRIITQGDQDFWIPKSLIQRGTEIENVGDDGILVLPVWFARKELIPATLDAPTSR